MKRIISLILVLATAFLTLTGCAFRYDKKDMSKYAEFDEEKFYNDLQKLSITLGGFSTDPETREKQVKDAVAAALLKATEASKLTSGTISTYDSVYFCYYATDSKGNIFYASKLDEAKPTSVQLSISAEGLNAEFAKALLGKNIEEHLYSTSSGGYVKLGDVVSVSYIEYNSDGTVTNVWNRYLEITSNDEFSKQLLEKKAQVGISIPTYIEFNETEGNTTVAKKFGNVKVESVINAAKQTEDVVADNDTVYISYVLTVDSSKLAKDENGSYIIPAEFEGMNAEIKGDSMKIVVSYQKVTANELGADDPATLESAIVGKSVGTKIPTVLEKGKLEINGEKVDVKYTDVDIHWIQKTSNAPITFEYTPYEAYDETKKNEKTEKNIYNEVIRLNGEKLTYHVFPIYYTDVLDSLSEGSADLEKAAKLILKECYTEATGKIATAFPSLKKNEYKNGENTVSALVAELSNLLTTLSTKKTSTSSALTELTTAQKNFATTKHAAESEEWKALKTKRENAETKYLAAKQAEVEAEALVNTKINEIVACKSGETSIVNEICTDYKQYHYDTLDANFRADVKKKLATAITTILKSSVTFKDNLPKRAVKEAYNAIMDSYQHDFYEGNFSSGETTSSAPQVSNYSYYEGNFNRYLIATVLEGKEGTIKDAKAAVKAKAAEAVKDVMYIYIFTQMVEEAWDTELSLTKEEKKNIKANIEYQVTQYQLMYGYAPEYDINDVYNGSQYDKVMEYLLTVTEVTNEAGVKVDSYTNIQYNK